PESGNQSVQRHAHKGTENEPAGSLTEGPLLQVMQLHEVFVRGKTQTSGAGESHSVCGMFDGVWCQAPDDKKQACNFRQLLYAAGTQDEKHERITTAKPGKEQIEMVTNKDKERFGDQDRGE